MHACWEVVDVGLLTSEIEDTDLGVGDTTVEAGLGVRLDRMSVVFYFDSFFLISRKFENTSTTTTTTTMARARARFLLDAPTKIERGEISSSRTHLVLAVAVASGGTTGHLESWKWGDVHFLRTVGDGELATERWTGSKERVFL